MPAPFCKKAPPSVRLFDVCKVKSAKLVRVMGPLVDVLTLPLTVSIPVVVVMAMPLPPVVLRSPLKIAVPEDVDIWEAVIALVTRLPALETVRAPKLGKSPTLAWNVKSPLPLSNVKPPGPLTADWKVMDLFAAAVLKDPPAPTTAPLKLIISPATTVPFKLELPDPVCKSLPVRLRFAEAPSVNTPGVLFATVKLPPLVKPLLIVRDFPIKEAAPVKFTAPLNAVVPLPASWANEAAVKAAAAVTSAAELICNAPKGEEPTIPSKLIDPLVAVSVRFSPLVPESVL